LPHNPATTRASSPCPPFEVLPERSVTAFPLDTSWSRRYAGGRHASSDGAEGGRIPCGGYLRRSVGCAAAARGAHIDGLAATLRDLANGNGDRELLLARGLASVAELQRQLRSTAASLQTAEEVVVRQKALLEAATGMVEEARRWARSLWDDGPTSEEPTVLNEPEFAPAWLTADGPVTPRARRALREAWTRTRRRTSCGWPRSTGESPSSRRSGGRSPRRKWPRPPSGSDTGFGRRTDWTLNAGTTSAGVVPARQQTPRGASLSSSRAEHAAATPPAQRSCRSMLMTRRLQCGSARYDPCMNRV
jgi:hypothetical protein